MVIRFETLQETLDHTIRIGSTPTFLYFNSQPEGLGVAFFANGPGLSLIMYILTTLRFPAYNFDFHLLTTSVNAKYYYTLYIGPV